MQASSQTIVFCFGGILSCAGDLLLALYPGLILNSIWGTKQIAKP